MNYSPEEVDLTLKQIDLILKSGDAPVAQLGKLRHTLSLLRSHFLTHALRPLTRDRVVAGPFKDMALTNEAILAYRAPVLLGCYEHELHDVFENVIAKKYARVLNIGCSVGYYAIGLARRMPETIIEAFDIDPDAQHKCLAMAELNGVADRVQLSGVFAGEDFAKYDDGKTLVLMDIEGGEKELLDPGRYPALRKMDVIVEMHDLLDASISKTILARFAESHTGAFIKNRPLFPDIDRLLPSDAFVDPSDLFLLGWESRAGQTPWGVFYVTT